MEYAKIVILVAVLTSTWSCYQIAHFSLLLMQSRLEHDWLTSTTIQVNDVSITAKELAITGITFNVASIVVSFLLFFTTSKNVNANSRRRLLLVPYLINQVATIGLGIGIITLKVLKSDTCFRESIVILSIGVFVLVATYIVICLYLRYLHREHFRMLNCRDSRSSSTRTRSFKAFDSNSSYTSFRDLIQPE